MVPSAMQKVPERDERIRNALLTGSLLTALVGLTVPTMAVMVAQMLIGLAETFYVGLLGRDALVGVALVFPIWMLMTMTSAGGIGGGVASAVSRALGAGRDQEASALVTHALLLAVGFGGLFTLCFLLFGHDLYQALGGTSDALGAAVSYSNFVFCAAIPIWVVNLMSAALRGAGRVRIPAYVTIVGACLIVPLSPGLIFGIGPVPALGIAGAGIALLTYYSVAAIILLRVLYVGSAGIVLRPARLEARYFWRILKIGGLSALSGILLNTTVLLLTGLVGRFGAEALAGYGLAIRLDYLLIPLLFGLGTATLTMIGMSLGARHYNRVRTTSLVGTLIGAGLAETIGVAAAVFPYAWLGLFTSDAGALDMGAQYLRVVGPFYGAIGTISMLNYVAQAGGRLTWPLIGSALRLVIAVGVGWLAVDELSAAPAALFAIIAVAATVAALTSVAAACYGALWPGRMDTP